VAAILGTAFSFKQSLFGQFIEQNDHAAGEHTESFRQEALVARGSRGNDSQDSGMPRSNTQAFNPFGKAIGRVRAELSEQKGGACWAWWAMGFHTVCRQHKEITCAIQSFME